MKYGVAGISIIPLRKEPSHRSEMVSQLLFGETYEVVQEQNGWLLIKCNYDNYEGWIDANQYTAIADKEYSMSGANSGIALDLLSNATSGYHAIPIVTGSDLPLFDGLNFKLAKEKFIYNGQAVQSEAKNSSLPERVAMRYVNAPYLWGGRSPFGIDCSGFTQVVFKFAGVCLMRDAYQQAEQGSLVNFIDEALPGDLAFFNNEAGKITHVGMILKDRRIIHSSGKVRIDPIDHFGIYNQDLRKYSHQLKVLKRFF
ncbi:MAG TPA: C40 family peptidase [Chitinophagales bacterium]|nr:C40 family peptidase [Chitinophagales bacterium]